MCSAAALGSRAAARVIHQQQKGKPFSINQSRGIFVYLFIFSDPICFHFDHLANTLNAAMSHACVRALWFIHFGKGEVDSTMKLDFLNKMHSYVPIHTDFRMRPCTGRDMWRCQLNGFAPRQRYFAEELLQNEKREKIQLEQFGNLANCAHSGELEFGESKRNAPKDRTRKQKSSQKKSKTSLWWSLSHSMSRDRIVVHSLSPRFLSQRAHIVRSSPSHPLLLHVRDTCIRSLYSCRPAGSCLLHYPIHSPFDAATAFVARFVSNTNSWIFGPCLVRSANTRWMNVTRVNFGIGLIRLLSQHNVDSRPI